MACSQGNFFSEMQIAWILQECGQIFICIPDLKSGYRIFQFSWFKGHTHSALGNQHCSVGKSWGAWGAGEGCGSCCLPCCTQEGAAMGKQPGKKG